MRHDQHDTNIQNLIVDAKLRQKSSIIVEKDNHANKNV